MPIHLISEILAERVARAPHAPAVVDGSLRLDNAALAERVDAVARALLARGVARGDRVATLAPPSADFWVLFLATASVGAIWQGLNPRYQRNEYAYLLGDARPKLVLARSPFEGRDYLAELAALAPAGTGFAALGDAPLAPGDSFCAAGDAISPEGLTRARAAVDPEDTAVIVYTSGTTGQPKGAQLSHRAIVRTALANVAWTDPGALDCTICAAPINHVGALDNVCMTVFAGGGRIVFHPRVDLDAIAALNKAERPSYLVSSPTAFAMMLARPRADLSSRKNYRLVVFGGAATPAPTLREIQKLGARMSSVYGQTETCGMITTTARDAPVEVMAETIGRPVDGVEIRIADERARPAAVGVTGEIQVRGVCVMSGYWGKPEATREAFTPDGWLRTGDLGFLREDGNVVFAGRLKEMFKSGGYNVYPVEVELAICEHADVAQAAVVAVPHPTFQEVGHGFLQPKPGATLDPQQVRAFLRERIADYKVPKTWSVLDTFPALPSGKIDKRALRASLPV